MTSYLISCDPNKPGKYKYPPNDPFFERRHSKVFRKRQGEFFEVVIFFPQFFAKSRFFFTKLSYQQVISHTQHMHTTNYTPKHILLFLLSMAIPHVRLLHSMATYRGPTCKEHLQAFWSTQANSDISLLHVKIIIYLLENYIEPQNIIYAFLAKTLENVLQ